MTEQAIPDEVPPSRSDAAGDGAPARVETETHAQTVAELFHKHNRSLVSLLTARLRSVEEAKEVAQEAYVKLLQLDCTSGVSLLQAYLFRTACNLAVDRLRQRGTRTRLLGERSSELFAELSNDGNEIESGALATDELRVLQASLDELPAKCRHTFLMYRVDGLDQEAIGRQLSITRRMVRYYIAYALKYCRLRLGGATAQMARERLKR